MSCIEAIDHDEETEKEIDRHIRHLNSTELQGLEDGIAKTAEEIDQIMKEAKSLGCIVRDKDGGEIDDTDPLHEEAPPSDICKPILTELEETKMKHLVLKAVKTLDDDICLSEMSESREERKKRSIATLRSIDEQLDRGAKLLGKVKCEDKIPRKRRNNFYRLTSLKQRCVIWLFFVCI